MFNGIYSSASALDVNARQHEIIANNLANLNVPGFRRTVLAVETRGVNELAGNGRVRSNLAGTQSLTSYTDFTPGAITATGRPLDVALHGDGFFKIQGPQGDLYTRDGSFQLLTDGQLVTTDGLPVLGQGGPIFLPTDIPQNQLQIGSDGLITAGEIQAGNLDIVAFADNRMLVQQGPTRFTAGRQAVAEPSTAIVQQGSLEMANASAVTEMISMMIGMRHFEAAQQTLRNISEAIRQFTTLDM